MNKLEGPSFLPNKKPKKLIFLLHGYGDNAENFIHLSESLNDHQFQANFYAPNAPTIVPQYPLGRQWFEVYPNGVHISEAGSKEKEIIQKEYKASVKQLEEYINNLCLVNNLTHQDCFIIGFSQGAMIAYELGNYMKSTFAGCSMLSGRILSSDQLDNNFFIKTPLLIIHGDIDEIVDPKYFTKACQIAKSKGFMVQEHLIKNEGHTISQKTLEIVHNFIKKYV